MSPDARRAQGPAQEDFIAQRDALQKQIDDIKLQLQAAKANAWKHGVYRDPNWFHAATNALKCKQRQMQTLLAENGQRRRADKARLEAIFFQIARQALPGDVFDELLAQARATQAGDA